MKNVANYFYILQNYRTAVDPGYMATLLILFCDLWAPPPFQKSKPLQNSPPNRIKTCQWD